MEFKIEELRIGNKLTTRVTDGDAIYTICEITKNGKDCYLRIEESVSHTYKIIHFAPLPLTKEILRDNLGFEISDMGDFWQCQREDFILLQIKLSIGNMPFMFPECN